jgi:hypothetical protein
MSISTTPTEEKKEINRRMLDGDAYGEPEIRVHYFYPVFPGKNLLTLQIIYVTVGPGSVWWIKDTAHPVARKDCEGQGLHVNASQGPYCQTAA